MKKRILLGAFAAVAAPMAALTPSDIILVHFADGLQWTTNFTVVNLDTQPASFTLYFYADNGSALPLSLNVAGQLTTVSSYQGNLGVNGSLVIQTTGGPDFEPRVGASHLDPKDWRTSRLRGTYRHRGFRSGGTKRPVLQCLQTSLRQHQRLHRCGDRQRRPGQLGHRVCDLPRPERRGDRDWHTSSGRRDQTVRAYRGPAESELPVHSRTRSAPSTLRAQFTVRSRGWDFNLRPITARIRQPRPTASLDPGRETDPPQPAPSPACPVERGTARSYTEQWDLCSG